MSIRIWRAVLPLALLVILHLLSVRTEPATAAAERKLPKAPIGLRVEATTESTVTIAWQPSEDADRIEVYRILMNGRQIGNTSATRFQAAGLVMATAYKFTVIAKDSAGTLSEPSAAVWAKTDGYNLLENGGFEDDSDRDKIADGWVSSGGGVSRIAGPVFQGKFALRMSGSSIPMGEHAAVYRQTEVQPGKLYVFEANVFIKQINHAKLELFLDFYDSQGRWVGENSKSMNRATHGFAMMQAFGVVPDDASRVFALIRIKSEGESNSGVAVVDNVKLRYANVRLIDSFEPNNSMSKAQAIQAGIYESYLGAAGDEDWYIYTTGDKDAKITLSLEVSEKMDADIEVRSSTGRILDSGKNGKGAMEFATVSLRKGQSAYIRVAGARAEDYGREPYFLSIIETGGSSLGLADGADITDQGDRLAYGDSAEFLALSAVQGKERIFIAVEGKALSANHILYIDTDQNDATGYRHPYWLSSGIDYKIESNRLFQFKQSDMTWVDVGAVWVDLSHTHARFALYVSQIGKPFPSRINIAYEGAEGETLPHIGESMFTTTASIQTEINPDTYYPKELFGPIPNPYIGWVGSASGGNNQAYSMVFASIAWSDLEPEKGIYDWEGVERLHRLPEWKRQGKRIVLRLVTDIPGARGHKDIPEWLYNELVESEGTDKAGTWYNAGKDRAGFSPNYSSKILIQEHKRLLRALAGHYDQDPGIAFVEIGSLGHHGEFHTSLIDADFPKVSVSDQYIQHYIDFFHYKKLGMRKPFPIAARNKLGLYNDMLGEDASTDEWINWTKEGWRGIREYADAGDDPVKVQLQSQMPDFWRWGYSGGEFSSSREAADYVEGSSVLHTLDQIRNSHTSWIGASALLLLAADGKLSKEAKANMDLLQNAMGYRFVLGSFRHNPIGKAGEKLDIAMEWSNKGVAPFYYDWKLEVALADRQGNLIPLSRMAVNTDIRDWLPGKRTVSAQFSIPETIPIGSYRIVTAIIDPDTGKPGMNLAIEGKRNDGWYELSALTIN